MWYDLRNVKRFQLLKDWRVTSRKNVTHTWIIVGESPYPIFMTFNYSDIKIGTYIEYDDAATDQIKYGTPQSIRYSPG